MSVVSMMWLISQPYIQAPDLKIALTAISFFFLDFLFKFLKKFFFFAFYSREYKGNGVTNGER